ncbi:DUF1801 domain-containing protein [Dyadobacter psychrophilus]|uniref:YdhG-like domain-containing protein n=1 Tax=Dyadobacter psychrophilus TaxID=651661 RepID=A0A1T5B8X5_9BACT|nr:DUF1801 domain-containing protein [Dyadobacter psychrophilus]SKB43353.1 protein of unknown function (DU1801) [Dyadobacter psychrophilus]
MTISLKQFIDVLPADRQLAFTRLRDCVVNSIPEGFEESFSENSLNYTVPHSLYPGGYHCNSALPLPFVSITSQKNVITLHHMGLYADPDLFQRFSSQYAKQVSTKLDMGKGCIRFKKPDLIPYELISDLMSKISAPQWITLYEGRIKR